jgi:hypothetical protein
LFDALTVNEDELPPVGIVTVLGEIENEQALEFWLTTAVKLDTGVVTTIPPPRGVEPVLADTEYGTSRKL